MKRWDIINYLIEKYELKSYLEIGVFKGECFNKVVCDMKISVDPVYESTHRLTSDAFFIINTHDWDLIFIDGLHTAEQTYTDMVNAHNTLTTGGFIVVHDCNPETEWHARPVEEYKQGEEWNGTTYRGFIRFRTAYPNLTCRTVDTDYGVGIVTDRKLEKETFNTYYQHFNKHRVSMLGLISEEKFKHYF